MSRFIHKNTNHIPKIISKLQEVYFKANQNIQFIGESFCNEDLKEKFYNNSYYYIEKHTKRLGATMNDTGQCHLLFYYNDANRFYTWERNQPLVLVKNVQKLIVKEFSDLYLEIGLVRD